MVCKVNNYSEYVDYLKSHENMTLDEIKQFVGESLLTDRFGIKAMDVKRDLISIRNGVIREKEIREAFEKSSLVKNLPNINTSSNVKSKEYEYLLSEWSKPGKKLSIKKLESLYKANKLARYGLSLMDVVDDIKARGGEVGSAAPSQNANPSQGSKLYSYPRTRTYPISSNSYSSANQVSKVNHGPIISKNGVAGKAKGVKPYEFLVSEWAKLGPRMTQYKLEKLYKANNLQNLGISVHDVAADIEAYRNGNSISVPPPKPTINNNTVKKRVESSYSYEFGSLEEYTARLLEYLWEKKDRAYLENEIKAFAVSNGIHSITNDYSNDIRLDLSHVASGNNPISKIAKALSQMKQKSPQPQYDTEFRKNLGNVISKHKDRVDDAVIFRNILWDYFPDRKMEISILGNLFQYGINEDIRKTGIIDDVFVMRYAERLSKDYGIEKAIAKNLTEIWCGEYKKSISS